MSHTGEKIQVSVQKTFKKVFEELTKLDKYGYNNQANKV